MGHTTIYADQESVLGFINSRIDSGAKDSEILAASRSIEAIIELGHVVTREDYLEAVRYLSIVLEDKRPAPNSALGCIAFIREVFQTPVHMRLLSA